MLISRKLTKDKRVVTAFRYLNVRIAKNNLAYPLLKDTFSVLGSSKCEVLSVLNLKDAFHSLRLLEKEIPINTVEYSLILAEHHICIRGCQWDQTCPPQYGNLTLMQFSIVFKAGNIVKQSWMISYYLPHQKVPTLQN